MWLQWCWQVQALQKSRLNDRFAKSRRAGTLHEEGEAHGMNVQAGQGGRSHPSVTFRGVLDAPPPHGGRRARRQASCPAQACHEARAGQVHVSDAVR